MKLKSMFFALAVVLATPVYADSTQQQCLAENLYHEARGEGISGMVAVAWVVKNRVQSAAYPDTYCGVVTQAKRDRNGAPIKGLCQFSWYCDGKADAVQDDQAFLKALDISELVMSGEIEDPTNGATMFHSKGSSPYWIDAFDHTVTIKSHKFYR